MKHLIFLVIIFAGFLVSGCGTTIQDEANVISPEPEPVENSITIHALGDSLTAGYQLPIEDSYPSQLEKLLQEKGVDLKILNGGISGDTSEGLVSRLDRQLETAVEDDIAILVIGANDGLRGLPIDQMKKNISGIVEKILEKQLFLIIGGMKIPLNNSPEYRQEFENVYTDLCEELASNDRVSCMDFFLEGVAGIPTLNLPDGIHPTKQGYEIIVKNLSPFVESHIKKIQ